MNKQTPSLTIPYIPELENLSQEEIIHKLDNCGERRNIDCLNWKEQFP